MVVVLDERGGLLFIDLEPVSYGVFGIIGTLNQRFSGYIILAFHFRGVEDDVITTARGGMNATAGDTLDDEMGRHIHQYRHLQRHTHLIEHRIQRFRL